MPRFAILIVAIIITVFPSQGFAGKMSFDLPFSFMGLATCVALDEHKVKASCDWKRNKKNGYDIRCDFDRKLEADKDRITFEMNTWRTGKAGPIAKRAPGQRLSYKYRGIKCTLFSSPFTSGFKCSRNSDGFGCKWCGKKNCYQGKATINHKSN